MGKGFAAGRTLCLHRLAVEPLIARARHISCGNEGPIQTTRPGARGSDSQVLTGYNTSVVSTRALVLRLLLHHLLTIWVLSSILMPISLCTLAKYLANMILLFSSYVVFHISKALTS